MRQVLYSAMGVIYSRYDVYSWDGVHHRSSALPVATDRTDDPLQDSRQRPDIFELTFSSCHRFALPLDSSEPTTGEKKYEH